MNEVLARLRRLLAGGRKAREPLFGAGYDSFQPDRVSAAFSRATSEARRQVLVIACEFAKQQSGLYHPLALEALEAVWEGESLPPDRREQLRQLADEFDGRYIELDALAEAGQPTADEAQAFFRKYVAGNALYFATSDDPVRDAHHAVYDASHASDDPAPLMRRIEEPLG